LAGVIYQCPNCGGHLAFDPQTQQWKCPFCDSLFDKDALTETEQQSAEKPVQEQPAADGQLLYRCPTCGSEIITSATTAATHCYYCHNPVVLQGQLTDDMRPDEVLPFTISKQQAVDAFMKWVKGKKYVPAAFFSKAQVENMVGVYYPHFVTDCEVKGTLEGEGCSTSLMDAGSHIITSTRHYHVRREANLTFRSIMRPALKKANRKLSDGIHPFPLGNVKPFEDAYLSGFLAERRDVDASDIAEDVAQEVGRYVQPMLRSTVSYDRFSGTPSAKVRRMDSRYVLLPTWVLTYPNKQNKDDPYYYAMNGCTGEVCGKLPLDKKKLSLTALGLGAVIFVIGCLLCYFVF